MQHTYLTSLVRTVRDESLAGCSWRRVFQTTERAERLLFSLQGNQKYSCGELYGRLTGKQPNGWNGAQVAGQQMRRDLMRLIEDLSQHAPLPADQLQQPVYTCEELARQFHVSTKTIARWRRAGLVGRRFLIRGRKRLGFLEQSVRRFVACNRRLVERAGRFRHLTPDDRSRIVESYRRLQQEGLPHGDCLKRIAEQVSCSVETARQVIKQHRVRRVMELPLDFIPNQEFEHPDADQRILTEMPENPTANAARERPPAGLPAYLTSLYDTPLLSAEQEVYLFRKMNYLKYKASRLRSQLDPHRPRPELIDQIEALYEEVVATKNQIIRANLRLVVSLAKSRVSDSHDFYTLISDGNMSLMRAVEKFDYSRGFKFSTYATWAVVKNFARSIPDEVRQRNRYTSLHDELLGSIEDGRGDQRDSERYYHRNSQQVNRLLSYLNEREQRIITSRFGLDYRREPLTLREIGEELGVTKERVRQLQSRAMRKLQEAAKRERIEVLEVT